MASVAPGITIRLGEKVGIDFQANLIEFTRETIGEKGNYEETKSDPSENLQIGPDFNSLSLGISFFL